MKLTTEQPHWSAMAERGSYWGIYFLLKINQIFGRWLFRLFIWPIVVYFFITGKNSRRASLDYLTRLYHFSAGTVFSRKPGYWQSLKHFISFAESALDKIDGWSGKYQTDDVHFVNQDIYQQLTDNKQGAVFIGSHLGNLELCRALNKHDKTRINVMVFTHHAQAFNRILKKIDPNMDINLIQVDEVSADLAIMLKQRLDDGEHIVIAADRTSTTRAGRVMQVDFLGSPAPIGQGPFILASLMDCPVYMMFCFKQKHQVTVIFETFDQAFNGPRQQRQQRLAAHIRCYLQRLEHYCRQYPYQWFNFFDFWFDDRLVKRQADLPHTRKTASTKVKES